MALSKPRSRLAVAAGIVLLLVAVAVAWWASGGDGGRDGRAATVGLIVGVAGLVLTVAGWFLLPPATSARSLQRAGSRAVQAGGDVTGAIATGRRAVATAEPEQPRAATDGVVGSRRPMSPTVEQRSGAGGVQGGGDITGAVATGDDARADAAGRPTASSGGQPGKTPNADPPQVP